MLKGERLSQAYASGDVFVMPSETETLGFVVLEAMASGVPVVAVAAGGLTDIITEPGKTGLLYKSGDYEGLWGLEVIDIELVSVLHLVCMQYVAVLLVL